MRPSATVTGITNKVSHSRKPRSVEILAQGIDGQWINHSRLTKGRLVAGRCPSLQIPEVDVGDLFGMPNCLAVRRPAALSHVKPTGSSKRLLKGALPPSRPHMIRLKPSHFVSILGGILEIQDVSY